ncbi:MAG: hypothetical protein L3K26_08435, partial [Candidatus Hydrogenedentes bacterium]|nr:hypothetical protein [Candidatus Hydrogenedentota bacterium]
TLPDSVRVPWSATPDAGVEYRVYRGTTDSFADAIALSDWTTALQYDDTTATPPVVTETPGGCNEPPTVDVELQYFFYWVLARVEGSCEGDPGLSDRGHVGQEAEAAAAKAFFAPALPGRDIGENPRLALQGEDLAVRLRSEIELDPASIWAEVDALGGNVPVSTWQSNDGGMNDIWVIQSADAAWQPGDQVTITVGALTVEGDSVGPITFTFDIAASGKDSSTLLAQPDHDASEESSDELGLFREDEVEHGAALNGLGDVYRIRGGVFETPQRVWVPLPAGLDPSEAVLYYYHENGEETLWYPAEDIAGWLVEDSYLYVELDGVPHLGFTVRHEAIVQLGHAPAAGEASASAAMFGGTMTPGMLVNILLMAALALGFLIPGKRYARQED